MPSMTAIVWRESIAKNGLRCTGCNAPLWNITEDQPTEYLVGDHDLPDYKRCRNCDLLVAFTRDISTR